ncbi:MAG: DUF2252 domain-containing protein [Acidobacteriota bacterium]|nr:DUF2252 domain-containing protein [Acidobacteriota bacterium]
MSQYLTRKERLELGRQRRKQMRRSDHSNWDPKLRKQSPSALLRASLRGRVAALVPVKEERMAATPFAYFRGAVPVMAADLALLPRTGIANQLCGDAHVCNLGAYEGPDGRLLFDINDFDETIVGPFEWDVKRMATSLILAGRTASVREGECAEAALIFLDRYRRTMLRFSRMPVLEVIRHQVHRMGSFTTLAQIFAMAQRATPVHNLERLTEIRDGRRIFRDQPPALRRVTGREARQVLHALGTYTQSLLPERRSFLARYRPLEVAFKVVGTGSVGLRDYVVYLEGNGPLDPLFLQIKQAVASAYGDYLPATASPTMHHGQRVIEGERAMQLQSDPFLGWTSMGANHYLVRQLNDHKAAIDVAHLRATTLQEYAAVSGEILARAHARAGDCVLLAGYLGPSARFDEAIVRFAHAYADQTEADWKSFLHERAARPAAGKHTTGKS